MFHFAKIIVVIILLLGPTVFAQTIAKTAIEGIRIRDDKADFSVVVPANFVVDSERPKQTVLIPAPAGMLPGLKEYIENPRITGTFKSVRMELRFIEMQQVSSAKGYFWFFTGLNPPKDKTQDFVIGDFVGRQVVYDTDKYMSMTIAIALKSRMFVMHATGRIADRPTYEAFVTSLMLNNRLLFKDSPALSLSETKIEVVSQLSTSTEVMEALKQKTEKSDIGINESTSSMSDDDSGIPFARPVITLRHPEFFSADNFPKGVKMPITIRVTYLASGKIGSISIPSGMPKSFAEAVRKAATEVRFLPAEQNGKKVDSTLVVNYPPFST